MPEAPQLLRLAFGDRGWERWAWRVAAVKCCPLPDSSRHGMSWKICRFSAPRPEPRSAQEPRGLAPFSRLFRFSASVDHQMTPALFAGAFRAGALPPRSLADWLSGTPAAALRPKASRRAGLRGGEVERWAEQRLVPLERWATGIACTADLKHHAACREGRGSGLSVGQRALRPR